jgi:fructokinase
MADASRSTPPRILSIGEILIDLIVADEANSLEAAESFVARPGGAPANAAVALARLGLPSAFCGAAGGDPFGARLVAELTAAGVDSSRLRQSTSEPTTLAFAWKDSRGDGHFWLLRGADASLAPEDAERAGISGLAALVVGSVSLSAQPSRGAIERAVDLAQQANVPVFFDVNLRPTLWTDLGQARSICEHVAGQCRVVKLSLDDARGLLGTDTTPESAIRSFLSLGPRSVVLTDGERGCWLATATRPDVQFVPAFAVDAVEPTGAGDAFSAALIARSLESGWQPLGIDDLRYAAAAGALATTKRGAWEGLPTREQLTAFLATS